MVKGGLWARYQGTENASNPKQQVRRSEVWLGNHLLMGFPKEIKWKSREKQGYNQQS